MKTVDDALFNPALLTMDEAKRLIDNFHLQMTAIKAEAKMESSYEVGMLNIRSIIEQTEEQNKRILKRLL